MAIGFNNDKAKVNVAEQTTVADMLASQIKVKIIKNSNITITTNIAANRVNRVPSGSVAAIPMITGASTAILGISTACSIDTNAQGKSCKTWVTNCSNYTWNGEVTTYVFYTGEDDS